MVEKKIRNLTQRPLEVVRRRTTTTPQASRSQLSHRSKGGELVAVGDKDKNRRIHGEIAKSHPKLMRGMVKCDKCGKEKIAKSEECLKTGWPECCGYTMRLT